MYVICGKTSYIVKNSQHTD